MQLVAVEEAPKASLYRVPATAALYVQQTSISPFASTSSGGDTQKAGSPGHHSTTALAARAEAPDLTEAEVREALERLNPLWDELFPAEQARIVRALVECLEVGSTGADIRLRVEGLASLVRDLVAISPDVLSAAA